jgi:hypothetical protein
MPIPLSINVRLVRPFEAFLFVTISSFACPAPFKCVRR